MTIAMMTLCGNITDEVDNNQGLVEQILVQSITKTCLVA